MARQTETLIWSGRPNARLRFDIRSPMEFAFGLSLLGGPITPMLLLMLGDNPLWMLFAPLPFVGLWMLGGWCIWEAVRQWRTRYYLSDERAVIDTVWPWGVRRREFVLTPDTDMRLDNPHLWFDREPKPTWDGQPPRNIGFEYLDDAARVADQMRRALWALSLPPKAVPRDI